MPTELGPISSAPRQLRPEVQVRVTNGEIELVDLSTSLVVDVAVQGSLEQLLADDEVWDGLKELGLAADGASRAEIIQRQRQFNQESRAERWADFLKRCLSTRHYARHAARLTGADDGLAGFITTKDQLRAAPEDFVFDKINSARGLEDGSVGLATSSGTTGERLQVFGDPWLLELPLHFRPWGDGPARRVLFTTPRCMGSECHLVDSETTDRTRPDGSVFLQSVANPFSMTREFVKKAVDEIDAIEPNILMVNAVYLHALVRGAKRFGLRIRAPKVILSSYQYLSKITRRVLEEEFQCPVLQHYSASDVGGCRIALECEHGHLHVREDHVFVDIVDGAGQPVPSGAVGRVAVSPVGNRVLGLLRYTLGDLASAPPTNGDHVCALALWPTLELHGRERDVVTVNGQQVTTKMFDDWISEISGIEFYQCRQASDDTFNLAVVVDDAAFAGDADLSRRFAQRWDGASVRVQIRQRIDPEMSLKFSFLNR